MRVKPHFAIIAILATITIACHCRQESDGSKPISGVKRPTPTEVEHWMYLAEKERDADSAMKLSVYFLRFENNERDGYYWLLKSADYGDPSAQAAFKDRAEAWQNWRSKYQQGADE